jgi:Holliday junction resolvasome RuvABC endonuclease subunit
MTMNVLGLDLSMTATGICLPDGRTLTVATNAKDRDRRLVVIRNEVRGAVIATRPDLVVMEEAPPGLKGSAIKAIHMVQGAVRVALLDLEVPCAVVNPSTLKAYATGKKGADKTAMAMAAFKRAALEFPDDNQCDAWWLRVMGMDWHGFADVLLPMAQRDFMKSVDWPKLADPVDPEKLLQLAEFAYRPTLREQLDEASPVRVGSSDPVPCHFEAR